MFLAIYFTGLLFIPLVRADGWDDFSNNLATDLAPLLALFGEQITKQYLSESITLLDNFIFAMAPMGILTAVVSAIRVCGSPSLRAFIGRAQEGRGIAEAELCSSTSRDVCELYNNGGIARVFGRPKILEIVYDPHDPDLRNKAGIYTFQEYLDSQNGKNEWNELSKGKQDLEENDAKKETFAPNLSLNVGIKRQPLLVFWAVATMGLILQAGVLGFAIAVTYVLQWDKDGSQPESYACPVVIVGTIMVCSGSFLCAFLVGHSTNERLFRRNKICDNRSLSSSLYWLQPGGQTLGDQMFDPFCYSDHDTPLDEYITSSKNRSGDWARKSELVVWVAVGTTVSGFVLQFVGLRGIHSGVSVAQLGAILVMSMARAALRMQRLKPEDNFLRRCPDEVIGHELDWLALRISEPGTPHTSRLWRFCGSKGVSHECLSAPSEPSVSNKLLLCRTRLAELTQSPTPHTKAASSAAYFGVDMIKVRESAMHLALAMESAVDMMYARGRKVEENWQKATSLYCSFVYDAASMSLQENSIQEECTPASQTQSVLSLELKRGSLESPWTLQNKEQLEAVLGLWVWSLKFGPGFAAQVSNPQSGLTIPRTSEISARRIVTTNRHIADSDLEIWFGGMAPTLTEDELSYNSINWCDASTVWKRDQDPDRDQTPANKYKTLLGALPDNLDHVVRFFGWPAADLSQSPRSRLLKFWSAPTKSTLLALCTQEVFGSFIKSILGLVGDFGGVHVTDEAQHFRPENGLASHLTNLFIENRLGSREDASLCILPPFIPHLMRSSARSALAAAKKSADGHRRQQEWEKAEKVLRWAWNICHSYSLSDSSSEGPLGDGHSQGAAIALGELYRWALCDDATRRFGLNGIDWLSKQALHGAVRKIADRYAYIAERVCQQTAPVTSDQGELDSSVVHDLTATLLYLTQFPSTTLEVKGQLLCSAAKHNRIEVAMALLESGAEADFKDSESRTALSHAAESGSVDIAKELMNRGAFPDSMDSKHRTPLLYASDMGYTDMVEALLSDRRVNPNVGDMDEKTPLLLASEGGHETTVKLLLNASKVDVDAKDKENRTPLCRAAYEGHQNVVQLLLDRGAAIESKVEDGRALLSQAAFDGHKDAVQLLLDKGADIELQNENLRTPLWWAARNGHEAVVKLLLDKGAVVDPRDTWKETPLWWAATHGHEAVVKLLLQWGADIEARDEGGTTPLWRAAWKGNAAMVELLFNKGANIDSKSFFGQTPLWRAADEGNEAAVKILLDKGADITITNRGITVADGALNKGHNKLARLLGDKMNVMAAGDESNPT
ncbi:hypothetical protein FDECE_7606 [Fusarium decemcellulare]|nr:hypothetical protein FDECE_7606 [Fusarium decemcellulare]